MFPHAGGIIRHKILLRRFNYNTRVVIGWRCKVLLAIMLTAVLVVNVLVGLLARSIVNNVIYIIKLCLPTLRAPCLEGSKRDPSSVGKQCCGDTVWNVTNFRGPDSTTEHLSHLPRTNSQYMIQVELHGHVYSSVKSLLRRLLFYPWRKCRNVLLVIHFFCKFWVHICNKKPQISLRCRKIQWARHKIGGIFLHSPWQDLYKTLLALL